MACTEPYSNIPISRNQNRPVLIRIWANLSLIRVLFDAGVKSPIKEACLGVMHRFLFTIIQWKGIYLNTYMCSCQGHEWKLKRWFNCDYISAERLKFYAHSLSDGTHSLQCIHWWAREVMLHFSRSVLMKKQSQLHIEWLWSHFQPIFSTPLVSWFRKIWITWFMSGWFRDSIAEIVQCRFYVLLSCTQWPNVWLFYE